MRAGWLGAWAARGGRGNLGGKKSVCGYERPQFSVWPYPSEDGQKSKVPLHLAKKSIDAVVQTRSRRGRREYGSRRARGETRREGRLSK